MSLLLLALPPGAPGGYSYALSRDGIGLADHGLTTPALLPPAARGTEVVAIVPARRLSWHRVALPKGIGPGSPRLAAVLAGLLEDRLLDDPERLHFALAPDARPGETVCVAVCDKAWLTAHLKALEAAGRPAARIVPEAEPRANGHAPDTPRALVTGEPDEAELILTGCVSHDAPDAPIDLHVLPLPHDTQTLRLPALLPDACDADALELLAEPPVAQLAEQLFQRPAQLITPAQRWLAASRSRWDLAQMDLAQSRRARAARRLVALGRDLLYAPPWRPARWGLVLLVAIHLVGLNARAWYEKNDLAARRAQLAATLTATFPQVKVIIDAPAQMARAVQQLRQTSGGASPGDLEPMLAAWAGVSGSAAMPAAIDYSPGQLRLTSVKLTTDQMTQINARLRPQGYQIQTESDAAVLRTLAEVS
ncbi:MAG: general secretion pathway protein GspL [Burkholderiaceae bacterium]|jgi:general secretion pathway protein L|nr:general secretion pathway protein GspL [Burkholderiaceae bacterium]